MCSKIGKISEHQSTVNVDACTVKVQGIHCCIDVGVCRYLGTATESLAPSLFMVTKILKLTAKKLNRAQRYNLLGVQPKQTSKIIFPQGLWKRNVWLGKKLVVNLQAKI